MEKNQQRKENQWFKSSLGEELALRKNIIVEGKEGLLDKGAGSSVDMVLGAGCGMKVLF